MLDNAQLDRDLDAAFAASGFVPALLNNASESLREDGIVAVGPHTQRMQSAHDMLANAQYMLRAELDNADMKIAALKDQKQAEIEKFKAQCRADMTAYDLASTAIVEGERLDVDRLRKELAHAELKMETSQRHRTAEIKDMSRRAENGVVQITEAFEQQIASAESVKAMAEAGLAAGAKKTN